MSKLTRQNKYNLKMTKAAKKWKQGSNLAKIKQLFKLRLASLGLNVV